MPRIAAIALVAAFVAPAVACTDDSSLPSAEPVARPLDRATPTSAPSDDRRPSWDFVVQADGAAVVDGVGPLVGTQVLALRGVDPSVAAFTDRPARMAGTLRPDEFLALWHGSFGADPPNAMVQLGQDLTPVELRAATFDPARSQILFAVRPLPGPGGEPGSRLPIGASDEPTTLFVDAVGTAAGDVTDGSTAPDVAVLGDAPAMAMGPLYQVMSQSLALAAENATNSQSSVYQGQAATDQSVPLVQSVDVDGPPPALPSPGWIMVNGVTYSL